MYSEYYQFSKYNHITYIPYVCQPQGQSTQSSQLAMVILILCTRSWFEQTFRYFHPADPRGITQGGPPGIPTQLCHFPNQLSTRFPNQRLNMQMGHHNHNSRITHMFVNCKVGIQQIHSAFTRQVMDLREREIKRSNMSIQNDSAGKLSYRQYAKVQILTLRSSKGQFLGLIYLKYLPKNENVRKMSQQQQAQQQQL